MNVVALRRKAMVAAVPPMFLYVRSDSYQATVIARKSGGRWPSSDEGDPLLVIELCTRRIRVTKRLMVIFFFMCCRLILRHDVDHHQET